MANPNPNLNQASTAELCSEMVAQHRAHVAACDASGPLAKLVHAARELKSEIADGPTAPSIAAAAAPPPPPNGAAIHGDAQLQPATQLQTAPRREAAGGGLPSDDAHRTARAVSPALVVRLSVYACSYSHVQASVRFS